jgi:hypothetical protein
MKFWMSLLGGAAVLATVAVLAIVFTGGDDDKKSGSNAAARTAQRADALPQFELKYPTAWRRVEAGAKKGEPPRVVLARKDKTGMLTMAIRGPVKQSLASLEQDLEKRFKQRFPNMRAFESNRVNVAAGAGLHTTFVDGKTGQVQTNLVIPAGKLSYVLDAVVRGDSKKTAREVGLMLSAFDGAKAR